MTSGPFCEPWKTSGPFPSALLKFKPTGTVASKSRACRQILRAGWVVVYSRGTQKEATA